VFLEVDLAKLDVEMVLLEFGARPIKTDQGMHLVLGLRFWLLVGRLCFSTFVRHPLVGTQGLLHPISIQPLYCLHLDFFHVKLTLELRDEDQQRSLFERETRLEEKVLCESHVLQVEMPSEDKRYQGFHQRGRLRSLENTFNA
jgi:hypothetical protein